MTTAPVCAESAPIAAAEIDRTAIHYLSYASVPSQSANSIQIMQMCAAFQRCGHPVVLHCRRPERRRRDAFGFYGLEPSFEVSDVYLPRIPLASRTLYGLLIARRLARLGPCCVYGRDFYTLGLLARTKAPHRLTFEAHQPPVGRLEERLQRWIFESPNFRQLVVISDALGDEYRRRYGRLVADRVVLARDAANPPAVPAPELSEAGRPEPEAEAPLRLGYVGSLVPGKGLELLKALVPALPDCEFHLVGGSPGELDAWAGAAKPSNLVLHGAVPPARVSSLIAGFDVMLAPYQAKVLVGPKRVDVGRWMSPLKVFEAMAHGKPIVASDLPVLREILEHGRTALLADPEDARAWVEQIRTLQRDRRLRERLALGAQDDYRANHTWDRRAADLLQVLGPEL